MKNIIRILLILLISCSNVFSISLSRLVGNQPQFAVATVNDIVAWTEGEKTKLIDNFTVITVTDSIKPPPIVVAIKPNNFEVTVATSGLQFTSYSDFKNSVESKEYLNDKLLDIKPSIKEKMKEPLDYLDKENKKR